MKKILTSIAFATTSYAALAGVSTVPVRVTVVCAKKDSCPHVPGSRDKNGSWNKEMAENIVSELNNRYKFKKSALISYSLESFKTIVNAKLANPSADLSAALVSAEPYSAKNVENIFIVNSLANAAGVAFRDPLVYGKPLIALIATDSSVGDYAEHAKVFLSTTIAHEVMHTFGMYHVADYDPPKGKPISRVFENSLCGKNYSASYRTYNVADYKISSDDDCGKNHTMSYADGGVNLLAYGKCGADSLFSSADASPSKLIISCFDYRFSKLK